MNIRGWVQQTGGGHGALQPHMAKQSNPSHRVHFVVSSADSPELSRFESWARCSVWLVAGLGDLVVALGHLMAGLGDLMVGIGDLVVGLRHLMAGLGDLMAELGHLVVGLGDLMVRLGDLVAGLADLMVGVDDLSVLFQP